MIRDELGTGPFRQLDGRAVESQDDADRRVGQKLPHDAGMLHIDLIFASVVSPAPWICRAVTLSALRQGDDVLPG